MVFTNFGRRTEDKNLQEIVAVVLADYGVTLAKDTAAWAKLVKKQLVLLDDRYYLRADKRMRDEYGLTDSEQFRRMFFDYVGMSESEIIEDELLMKRAVEYFKANARWASPEPGKKYGTRLAPEGFDEYKAENYANRVYLVEQDREAEVMRARERKSTPKARTRSVYNPSTIQSHGEEILNRILNDRSMYGASINDIFESMK